MQTQSRAELFVRHGPLSMLDTISLVINTSDTCHAELFNHERLGNRRKKRGRIAQK